MLCSYGCWAAVFGCLGQALTDVVLDQLPRQICCVLTVVGLLCSVVFTLIVHIVTPTYYRSGSCITTLYVILSCYEDITYIDFNQGF
jgi:hypothetical protein